MPELTLFQSTAAKVVGRGYLSSDHLSTATGLDPAIMISKNCGNFANPNAGASVMTEIESTGWYYFELAAEDTATLGPLIIRGTHATMDNIEVVYQVVANVIGTAGAGLTAIPWNAAWDAEVESEASDALIALNLDHLAKTATAAADMTTEVSDNTILARILANGDTSAFDPSTDGLTLIHDDLATVDGNVDSILADTGTDGVLLADDAITSDVFDESTAFPQTTADTTPMVLP